MLPVVLIASTANSSYPYRKYQHVKAFYKDTTPLAIEVGLKYKVPPAALLAIAGLESGYGCGYVAQITGNILSLGAGKSDKELPRLYLPYSKSKQKILFDPKEIQKLPKNDLSYKLRSRSYKKDYRPSGIAGTQKELIYFKYHKKERLKAYKHSFEDFAKTWISKDSRYKAFREARAYLDKEVKTHGKKILFNMNTNKEFIRLIGGRPNSFNYRKSWPKKVIMVMKKTGLVPLTQDIYYNKKNFEDAWSTK
jgi:hypothetical protein